MYFAWITCDGIECVPLFLIILSSFLIPVIGGAVAAWFISGWLARKLLARKSITFSSRKLLLLRIGLIGIGGIIFLLMWWIPNSSYLKNYIYNQAVKEVSELHIYQLRDTTPASVKVTVSKIGFSDDAYYKADSVFKNSNARITISEQRGKNIVFGEPLTEYQKDKSYSCKIIVNQPSYCKSKAYVSYFADIGGKRIIINIDNTSGNHTIDEVLQNLELRQIQSLKNLEYIDRGH